MGKTKFVVGDIRFLDQGDPIVESPLPRVELGEYLISFTGVMSHRSQIAISSVFPNGKLAFEFFLNDVQ